jgi:hypothetical protein
MADHAHLNKILANTSKPLSRKLVQTFRDGIRDPSVSKSDCVQRLKEEMDAALHEGPGDETR